jgi:hypothetical protein
MYDILTNVSRLPSLRVDVRSTGVDVLVPPNSAEAPGKIEPEPGAFPWAPGEVAPSHTLGSAMFGALGAAPRPRPPNRPFDYRGAGSSDISGLTLDLDYLSRPSASPAPRVGRLEGVSDRSGGGRGREGSLTLFRNAVSKVMQSLRESASPRGRGAGNAQTSRRIPRYLAAVEEDTFADLPFARTGDDGGQVAAGGGGGFVAGAGAGASVGDDDDSEDDPEFEKVLHQELLRQNP